MKKKIIVEHVDCCGITLNKFEIIPFKKDRIGRSRIIIRTDDKLLGYFKVYDDETIEFSNETKKHEK